MQSHATDTQSISTLSFTGQFPAVKMQVLFLVLLYGSLSWASTDSSQNIAILMDNVLVLRVPYGVNTRVYVPLTCTEAHQNKPVFWKKDGVELKPALQGNNVRVLVEEMDGGNYTCHLSPSGEYLNHTAIMVQLDPDNRTVILEKKSPEEGHIHCSAPNYTGSFWCTWKKSKTRPNAAVLVVKAERNLEKISCELNADRSGVHCQHTNCPYKEEHHLIYISVYMYSYARLEAYKRGFYLRDIVSPERLPNLHRSEGNTFSWSYPNSWERPCTYYGLQFQVKVVHIRQSCDSSELILNSMTEVTSFEVNIKTQKYVFCVRAQDKYTSGPFSPWSHCKVNKLHVACEPSLEP